MDIRYTSHHISYADEWLMDKAKTWKLEPKARLICILYANWRLNTLFGLLRESAFGWHRIAVACGHFRTRFSNHKVLSPLSRGWLGPRSLMVTPRGSSGRRELVFVEAIGKFTKMRNAMSKDTGGSSAWYTLTCESHSLAAAALVLEEHTGTSCTYTRSCVFIFYIQRDK